MCGIGRRCRTGDAGRRLNQQAAAAGRASVGFLNPAIYTISKGANYATAFHDTTTGNNFWPSSPSKFSAVTGYDLCTGRGTPNGTNLVNALAGPPILAPLIVSNGFVLMVESCPNGAVDPAETVTVNFGLKNIGTARTTNLVATLLATGGILSPSGPRTFGVLSTNGTAVVQPFTFIATGNCGGTNTASLQLQDGAPNLGTVTFPFGLGQSSVSTVCSQNFDGVTGPALPAGWTTSTSGAQSAWVTSTSARDTKTNSAFSPDPASVGVNELDSPTITLPVGSAQFSLAWDPAVLRYVGSGSYGLTGLSAGSFGTTLAESGKLAFAWYDSAAVGMTLADGTVLFTANFEVIGKAGSVSAVALAGAPTAQEVSVDFALAAFGAQDGNVSVVGPGALVRNSGYAKGVFRLSVPTEKGRSYILEFTDALAPANWTALPAVGGDGTVNVLMDPAATNQQRF